MADKDTIISALRAQSNTIKTERKLHANTAERIGSMFLAIIDALEGVIESDKYFILKQDSEGVTYIYTPYSLVSDKALSSLGKGEEPEGGISYDRLDTWEEYQEGNGAVLSADLGHDLLIRIQNIGTGDGESEGSTVSFIQAITSGKLIGTLSIDGVATKLYAPAMYGWEEIGSKPVTISGFGITDAYTKTETDALLRGYATSSRVEGIEKAYVRSLGTINLVMITSSELAKIMSSLPDNGIALYLVTDDEGNLPSLKGQTYITVPASTALLFGQTKAFGVSVGDLLAVTKKGCRVIPLNDAKAATDSFVGAVGLESVWDKGQINKIAGIEQTANAALPKTSQLPHLGESNMNNALATGVYPWCTLGRPAGSTGAYTCIVEKTSTLDNNGYDTIVQTAFGREAELGKIYKRIIFKHSGGEIQYGDWVDVSINPDEKFLPLTGGTLTGPLTVPSLKLGEVTLTWDSDNGALKFDRPIYSTGAVSSLGFGEESGEDTGGGGSAPDEWAEQVQANTRSIANLQTDVTALQKSTFTGAEQENSYRLTWFTTSGGARDWDIPAYSAKGFAGIEEVEGVFMADYRMVYDILDYVDAKAAGGGSVDLSAYYTKAQTNKLLDDYVPRMDGDGEGTMMRKADNYNIDFGKGQYYVMLNGYCGMEKTFSIDSEYGTAWFTDYVRAASFDQASDATKKNVTGDAELSLDAIADAPLKYYTWKEGRDRGTQVGTLAQYWQEALPEVTSGTEGKNLGVNYGVLGTAMGISLARELRELKAEVLALREELKTLKGE